MSEVQLSIANQTSSELFSKKQISEMRERTIANNTVPKEGWEEIDSIFVPIEGDVTNAVDDIVADPRFVRRLRNIGTSIASFRKVSGTTAPSISMDGRAESDQDRQTFPEVLIPVPIFRKDFSFAERDWLAAMNEGVSLDLSQAEASKQVIDEAVEAMIFNGVNVKTGLVGASEVYGLTNHPNRIPWPISDWAAPGTTPETIISDALALIKEAKLINRRGPFMLYVASDIITRLEENFVVGTSATGQTIKERLEAISNIMEVKEGSPLADGSVTLVQWSTNTFDLAIAEDLGVPRVWTSGDETTTNFMMRAALTYRLKPDAENKLGVVHGTKP